MSVIHYNDKYVKKKPSRCHSHAWRSFHGVGVGVEERLPPFPNRTPPEWARRQFSVSPTERRFRPTPEFTPGGGIPAGIGPILPISSQTEQGLRGLISVIRFAHQKVRCHHATSGKKIVAVDLAMNGPRPAEHLLPAAAPRMRRPPPQAAPPAATPWPPPQRAGLDRRAHGPRKIRPWTEVGGGRRKERVGRREASGGRQAREGKRGQGRRPGASRRAEARAAGSRRGRENEDKGGGPPPPAGPQPRSGRRQIPNRG